MGQVKGATDMEEGNLEIGMGESQPTASTARSKPFHCLDSFNVEWV
jgi:hypothetical protein